MTNELITGIADYPKKTWQTPVVDTIGKANVEGGVGVAPFEKTGGFASSNS